MNSLTACECDGGIMELCPFPRQNQSKVPAPCVKSMKPKEQLGGFTNALNLRVKVDNHPLWGAQCLLTNENADIDTHREFIRNGVDVMVTNTYQASIEGFRTHLGQNETEAFNLIKKSVTLCKRAIEIEKSLKMISRDKEILIAGSVGPYGAFLADGSEYTGDYIATCDIGRIKEWHRPRIRALVEGGVDLLAFETIPALQEAQVLLELLREFPDTRAWLSFSCKDETFLAYGQPFVQVAEKCWASNPHQIVAVGVNCLAAATATRLIAELVPKNIPAIVYPNYGKIWDACKKVWTGPSVELSGGVEQYAEKWCELGVKYMGGCCGTSIETYQKMRAIVDSHNRRLDSSSSAAP